MASDETHILDLCDAILAPHKGLRQHRFDFLRGDKRGARPGDPPILEMGRKLPVDAYYPELDLVIEYRECQHSEAVPFMDRRMTVSGCSRGDQRRRYDERRRQVLAANGISLVEVDYSLFALGRNKRLVQSSADREILKRRLCDAMRSQSPAMP